MKKFLYLACLFLTSPLMAQIYLQPTPQFKPKVAVAAVFIENKGNILLLHRQNNKSEGNKWGIPGGKIDKNETPLQAAIREIREETGYDISKQPIEDVGTVYIEYNDKDHFTYHMFRTQLAGDPGAVKINFNEHKGFTWVTPAEALKMDLIKDEDACFKLVYQLCFYE